jgi:hypothetical protein
LIRNDEDEKRSACLRARSSASFESLAARRTTRSRPSRARSPCATSNADASTLAATAPRRQVRLRA